MPEDTYESLDAIEKHFGKLRKQAGDDEAAVKEVGLAEREAKADFREASAIRRELSAHRRDALAKAGIPEDFHEFVTGETAEAIDASVTKVKERLDKLTAANGADDAAAQKLYGSPLGTGGGTPPAARSTDNEKFATNFTERWNNREQVTKAEIDRFVQIQAGRHVTTALAETSRTFKRAGVDAAKVQ